MLYILKVTVAGLVLATAPHKLPHASSTTFSILFETQFACQTALKNVQPVDFAGAVHRVNPQMHPKAFSASCIATNQRRV